MNTLNTLALIAHVLIAASIIGLVLLQKGKGADAGAGFGAGASGTVFGARGSANFLSRSTAVMAALFFASSLALAYLNSNQQVVTSVLDSAVVEEDRLEVLPVPSEEESFDLPPAPETAESAESEESLPVVPE
jgi:preprotein translocase subunit SecG